MRVHLHLQAGASQRRHQLLDRRLMLPPDLRGVRKVYGVRLPSARAGDTQKRILARRRQPARDM